MDAIQDFFESDAAIYVLGGLGILVALYFVLNSSAVGGIVSGVSTVSDAVGQAAKNAGNLAAATVVNAQQQNTLTNAIVSGALGPIGALYNAGVGLNELDTYIQTGVVPAS